MFLGRRTPVIFLKLGVFLFSGLLRRCILFDGVFFGSGWSVPRSNFLASVVPLTGKLSLYLNNLILDALSRLLDLLSEGLVEYFVGSQGFNLVAWGSRRDLTKDPSDVTLIPG